MVKFENGYSVETVLDGSKLGIEPYSLQVLPNGELLILDSENSNVYKISSSLSLCKLPTFFPFRNFGFVCHIAVLFDFASANVGFQYLMIV